MNPETIDKLKQVFTPIAEKIGQGAQFGWEIVLKQQYVTAILGIFWAILGIITLIVLWKWAVPKLMAKHTNQFDDWGFLAGLVAVIGTFLGGFMFISGVYDSITHFINPAYYALDFFINLGGK